MADYDITDAQLDARQGKASDYPEWTAASLIDLTGGSRKSALIGALDMLHHYAFMGRHTASEARAIDGARAVLLETIERAERSAT